MKWMMLELIATAAKIKKKKDSWQNPKKLQ